MTRAARTRRAAIIIERIFKQRWNSAKKSLSKSMVTLEEIAAAIHEYNRTAADPKPLSAKNPANFFKDFIRNRAVANQNWPKYVLQRGFTARQVTGGGRAFEFVGAPAGETEAFPVGLIPPPEEKTRRLDIPTVNIALAARELARSDEAWLIQVIVKLRVIETHLAIVSGTPILQLEQLQSNIKLARTEIDALFLALEEVNDRKREFLITLEAKGRADDVLESQILEQVRAAFRMGIRHDLILPMAAKAIAPSQIDVLEFSRISRDEADSIRNLTVVSRAVYTLKPPIKGIGERFKRPKRVEP